MYIFLQNHVTGHHRSLLSVVLGGEFWVPKDARKQLSYSQELVSLVGYLSHGLVYIRTRTSEPLDKYVILGTNYLPNGIITMQDSNSLWLLHGWMGRNWVFSSELRLTEVFIVSFEDNSASVRN